MGQFLSSPVCEKDSEKGGDNFLQYGLSSMQGWRMSMEDSHSTILDLNKVTSYKSSLAKEAESGNETEKEDGKNDEADANEHVFDEQLAFFGVFDGHGGARVALFAGEHLPQILKDHADLINKKQYGKALQDAFLACDRAILDDPAMQNDMSGCAATTILCTKTKLVCANAGDSRIVLSVNGAAKPMSYDHKPSNEGEKARIVAAGGFVDINRVNGNLALSRCIGDFSFKKSANLPPEEQIVTAFPDIIEHDFSKDDDDFLIIACDGIWDCLTSQQCVDLVHYGISQKLPLTQICEEIIDVCVAPNSMGSTGLGCDNMSIAVVALLGGRTLDEWYDYVIKKNIKVEMSFKEMRLSLYKTELGPKEYLSQQPDSSYGENDYNETGIGKSLSQLISQSVATIQDGTYYIDASNNSALLASLGILPEDETDESQENEATIEEVELDGEQADGDEQQKQEDEDEQQSPHNEHQQPLDDKQHPLESKDGKKEAERDE